MLTNTRQRKAHEFFALRRALLADNRRRAVERAMRLHAIETQLKLANSRPGNYAPNSPRA